MSKGKKIYFILLILSILLISIFYGSYAIFTYKTETHGKLNIVAGTLDYKLESTYLKNNQIEVDANSTVEFNIKIISLNAISSKYELYYTLPDNVINVEVGYSSNTTDDVKGIIGSKEDEPNNTKEVKVMIKNRSNDKVTVTFGVYGGLINLDFDSLANIGNSLKEIRVGDVILAWTYNGTGTTPTTFPKKGEGYEVESVECNGIETTFDSVNWKIALPAIDSNEMVCNLIFKDGKEDLVLYNAGVDNTAITGGISYSEEIHGSSYATSGASVTLGSKYITLLSGTGNTNNYTICAVSTKKINFTGYSKLNVTYLNSTTGCNYTGYSAFLLGISYLKTTGISNSYPAIVSDNKTTKSTLSLDVSNYQSPYYLRLCNYYNGSTNIYKIWLSYE